MKPVIHAEVSDIRVERLAADHFRVHWRSGQDRLHTDTYTTGKLIRLAIWKTTTGHETTEQLTVKEVKAHTAELTRVLNDVEDRDLIAKCQAEHFEHEQKRHYDIAKKREVARLRSEFAAEAERLYLAGVFAKDPRFAALRVIGADLEKWGFQSVT